MMQQAKTLTPRQLDWLRAHMQAFADLEAISQRVQREAQQSRREIAENRQQ
jgi:hypothetical protein